MMKDMSSKMGPKDDFSLSQELLRKMVHLNGIFIVIFYYMFGQKFVLYLLTFGLVIALELEYFRLEWGKMVPFLKVLYRQKEEKMLGGHVFGAISSIIAIAVFSKDIASIAILMTVIGDAAAAIFGKAYGKHFIPHLNGKAIEGVLAEFLADIVIGIIYITLFSTGMDTMMWTVLIIMSVVATVTETITNKMDDNLLVPLFSGFWGEVIIFAFAYSSI